MSITDIILRTLAEHGRLAADRSLIDDHTDLYQAGLTSHASVNVMLALEGLFDIEFPDRMLRRGVFRSVSSIRQAIEELTAGAASPPQLTGELK
ncbi:acyl carrier protein [Nevskia soli]|uniref:acyl carrier protein n=1 Tax=Nevskia soli TaxID=418856 RepID=UPI000B1F66B9|nr:acyl carrier protein [Nevskia soli]